MSPPRTNAALAALAALACAAGARPAFADERPVAEALVVEAADPCLAREALAARLARWLERDTIDDRLLVMVLPTAHGADFALHRDGDRTAVRRFPALPADCEERIDALTLAIALALDATLLEALAAADAPTLEASRPRRPEATPEAPPPPPAPTAEAPATGEGPAFVASASLEGSFGLSPAPWLAVAFDLELSWAAVAIQLGAIGSPEQEVALGQGVARWATLGGRVALCLRHELAERWSLGGCATAAAGVLHASGAGYAEVAEADLPWLHVGARAALRVRPVDALVLGLYAEPRAAMVRPEVTAEDAAGRRLATARGELVGVAAGFTIGVLVR